LYFVQKEKPFVFFKLFVENVLSTVMNSSFPVVC